MARLKKELLMKSMETWRSSWFLLRYSWTKTLAQLTILIQVSKPFQSGNDVVHGLYYNLLMWPPFLDVSVHEMKSRNKLNVQCDEDSNLVPGKTKTSLNSVLACFYKYLVHFVLWQIVNNILVFIKNKPTSLFYFYRF